MPNMIEVLFHTIFSLLLLFFIPALTIQLLTLINRKSKRLLSFNFGTASQIYLAGIGIVIHECSHLIIAILFGHQITKFKLLVLPHELKTPDPANPDHQALGYVFHSWNERSLYQTIGNAFIGIAPVIGCTASLVVLTKYLNPLLFNWLTGIGKKLSTTYTPSWELISKTLTGFPEIQYSWLNLLCFVLWMLISINITVGGYDLSSADIRGSIRGICLCYLLMGLILFILTYCGFSMVINYWLTKLLIWFVLIMLLTICWSLIANLLIRLTIYLIQKFGDVENH